MAIEESINILNSNYIASKNLLKFSIKEENGVYSLFVDDTELAVGNFDEVIKIVDILRVVFREAVLNRGRA